MTRPKFRRILQHIRFYPKEGSVLKRMLSGVLAAFLSLAIVPPMPACAAPTDQFDYARQVLVDNPQVYYRLNEPAGATVAKDSSGNQIDATYGSLVKPGFGTGTGIFNDPQPRTFFASTNAVGTGAGDSRYFITVPTNSAYQSNAYTIEALITLPGDPFTLNGGFGFGGNHTIISMGPAGNTYPNYAWELDAAPVNGTQYKAPLIMVRNGQGVSSVGELYAGSTALVSARWNGTDTMDVFVNGVQVATRAVTGATGNIGQLRIGAPSGFQSGSETWDGSISDVAMYNYAVPANRLLAHALAWKGQQNNIGAATTGTPGTTTGPLHGLYGVNATTEYGGFQNYTPANWKLLSQLVDFSPRTDVNTTFVQNQRGNGIKIGLYADAMRSCSTSPQGGINCGGVAISGPNGGSFANAASLNQRSRLHTCDGSSDIYWNNQGDGHNTINDPTSPTLADDFNALYGYKQVQFGYDFVTLDNGVIPTNLVSGNGANFRIYDPKGSVNPLQAPLAGAYGITATSFSCMDNDVFGKIRNGAKVLYSDDRFVQGYVNFISRLNRAAFQNWSDADKRWFPLLKLPNFVGFWHENSFGGASINNESFLYQTFSGQVAAAQNGKWFVDFDHMFDGARTNTIQTTRLAMATLGYEFGSTGLQTDGNPGTSPVPYFVPLNPEVPTSAIRSMDDLREGDTWVRRYRDCYFNGVLAGRCAAIVYPTNNAKTPSTIAGYSRLLTIDNYVSGTTYKGNLTNTAAVLTDLTGTVTAQTGTTPTTGNYLTGVIVVQ